MANDDQREPVKTASFGATMKAVFWSFFGVRKRRDYEHDAANLNPIHVIVGGLIGVALVSELSNVRINRFIDTWQPDRLPRTWAETRARWARSNRSRTWIALTGFAAAIVGMHLV